MLAPQKAQSIRRESDYEYLKNFQGTGFLRAHFRRKCLALKRGVGQSPALKLFVALFVTREKILHIPIDKSTFFVYTEKCEFFRGDSYPLENFLTIS